MTTRVRSLALFALASGALLSSGCPSSGEPAKPGASADATNAPKPSSGGPRAISAHPVDLKPIEPAKLETVLKDLAADGKVVFVDFWATWCVPCRERFPQTVSLFHKYQGAGLVVVTVALEEAESTKDAAVEFLSRQGWEFDNYVFDKGAEEAYKAFEIGDGGLPHYRVYDKEGKLLRKFRFDDPKTKPTEADIENTIRSAFGMEPIER